MQAWPSLSRRFSTQPLFMARLAPLLGRKSSRWWQQLERRSTSLPQKGQVGMSKIENLELSWEMLGPEVGPIEAVVTPRGQLSREAARPLAAALALHGKRVLLWDRRSTGNSSAWAPLDAESIPEQEVQDLARLLDILQAQSAERSPICLIGLSSGARLSAMFAARHPLSVSRLILLPTGDFYSVATLLAQAYYSDCADAAETGGMEAVAEAHGSHFQMLAKGSVRARDELLAADLMEFVSAMRQSQAFLERFQGEHLLGLHSFEVATLQVPVLVLHHGFEDDRLHALEDATALAEQLPDGHLVVEPDLAQFKKAAADFMHAV
ncbi:ppsA [Symbiodinium pilosum]|uniref:PpsA protein n=1 Tax=Symbiodinium pilosum TaxID=2952 RepID=A0A812X496_SYMPI|nr:ppsA [Symbiodinium pilosum]